MASRNSFNMRLIFFIYLISTLFNFIDVFAQKIKEESSQKNSIEWEKVVEEKSKPLKKNQSRKLLHYFLRKLESA